jgi:hypothetical protein
LTKRTKPTTIRVHAAPGRRVPIHSSIATGVAGKLLIVDAEPVTLPWCGYVARRLRAGDLVEVREEPKAPITPRAPTTMIVTGKES